MVTLDELLDASEAKDRSRDAGRQLLAAFGAGIYWAAWVLAKALRLVLLLIAGVFIGLGWVCSRAAWPALKWAAAAFVLGWEQGKRSDGAA